MLKEKWLNRSRERGQSFMELAISLVFLLVLLSVVVDLGWAFYTMTALRDTTQEAAAYGTMCPDEDKIKTRLIYSTNAPLTMEDMDPDKVVVTFINGKTLAETNTPAQGDIVKVEVEYTHRIVVPFVGAFIGRYSYPLKVDVSDTIMVKECPGS